MNKENKKSVLGWHDYYDDCVCGKRIEVGDGYYLHNRMVRCFNCGTINQKHPSDELIQHKSKIIIGDDALRKEKLRRLNNEVWGGKIVGELRKDRILKGVVK